MKTPTSEMARSAVLTVRDLVTGYGKKRILNGVNVTVPRGGIVAVIGHNGAGKSTLLKAVFGLIPVWQGQIHLDERVITKSSPRRLLRAGVAYVPQGNRVFGDLTVIENLAMGGVIMRDRKARKRGIEHALAQFPLLRERLGQKALSLSGGEKQMLALAIALIKSPRLLLLDEPSLGLAPLAIKDALSLIKRLNAESGTSILIVEQKVNEVLAICSHVYALKVGNLFFDGPPGTLLQDRERLRQVFL